VSSTGGCHKPPIPPNNCNVHKAISLSISIVEISCFQLIPTHYKKAGEAAGATNEQCFSAA